MSNPTESWGETTLVGGEQATGPTQAWDEATLAGGEATLAGVEPPSPRTRPSRDRRPVERGTAIGRYLILATLGAGGMGVVYAAYDPELDRKVAVKLLRADGVGTTASEGKTRLLREAQALAKLAHPNVVAIHDVGTHGDEVFLAMEFVDGQPLGDWAKAKPRTWREKLAAVVEAGRGVAAAHAAGLLHRDLKPDNIMVATDGRVRVMDLGLARAQAKVGAAEVGDELADTKASPELAALAVRVTQAGAIMGTPAYMAPEQFRGAEVGTGADQFALCVTAWELLAGQRPYSGETLMELAANVLTGKRSPAPRGTDAPRWVWPILERGLAAEPGQRWPSIEALLVALERGHARARGRRILAGVAAVCVAAAGVAGWRELDERQRIAACEAEGQAIYTESWNDTTKQQLREGLLATGVPSAATVFDKTLPWLDAHAAAWAEARTGACMDAQVHGTWTADLLDRANWCLDERRLEFEALVAELIVADAQSIYKAIPAAAAPRSIDACRDTDLLGRLPAPPADRVSVVEIRRALARANALSSAGKHAEGLGVAESALTDARSLGWPPLIADAGLTVGELLSISGRYELAKGTLADAYFEAVKAGSTDTAADAATRLVAVVGYKLADHDDGKAWARHADARLAVLDEPDEGLRRANLNNALGLVLESTGAFGEAQALQERVLIAREVVLGADHPDVASSLNNLGKIHVQMGAHEQAKAMQERALAIREATLGPDHPDVAMSLANLANVHSARGDYDDAKALLGRALAIHEIALGRDHPEVSTFLNNLAVIHAQTGAYEQARALHERSLAIAEAAFGPDHPNVALALNNLALVDEATGAYAEAKAHYARALGIWEAALGPDHPNVATIVSNLAGVEYELGEYEEAKSHHARALAIYEATFGPDHPDVAYPLTGLADIALAQGRPADAVVVAERAVRVRATKDVAPPDLARSRFRLARALWDAPVDAGRDRARAIELATQARDAWRDAGGGFEESLAEAERWLLAHGVDP